MTPIEEVAPIQCASYPQALYGKSSFWKPVGVPISEFGVIKNIYCIYPIESREAAMWRVVKVVYRES